MSQMSTEDRLVYMANQIARNFAVAGDAKAALATADHIASFWDPSMKKRIFARADADPSCLNTIAGEAIRYLRTHRSPPHQTKATLFGTANQDGASDAG